MEQEYVCFKTKGDIGTYAFDTFGVSAKETDNAIGQFGTGLKYALAVLLRLGGTVELYNGLDRSEFTLKKDTFRGQNFEVIYHGDKQLPFTTHLGYKWELWMAFRELYCNTLDEQGEIGGLKDIFPEEGFTTIMVTCDGLMDIMNMKGEVVISEDEEPLYEDNRLAVYGGYSKHLFYKGVRAGTVEQIACFRYSLKTVDLTEDRTIKSSWSANYEIARYICENASKHVVQKIIDAGEGSYESTLSLSFDLSPEMSDTITKKIRNGGSDTIAANFLRKQERSVPQSARVQRMEDQVLSLGESETLRDAVKLAQQTGFNANDHKISVKQDLPNGQIAVVVDGIVTLNYNVIVWDSAILAKYLIACSAIISTGLDLDSTAMSYILIERLINKATE